jgi:hypothetical protein
MLVTAAATLLGIWKHLEGNIGFIHEMHPATSGWPLLAGALIGRAPLLASGVLAAAAITAPKALVPFTAAEGAGMHTEALARTLYDQRMFDWLGETLGTND